MPRTPAPSLKRFECPICNSGSIGIKWIRDYYQTNKVTISDLCEYFHMTEEEVREHLNSHDIVVVNDDIDGKRKLSSPDFILNELSTLYTAVYDCFNDIRNNETDSIKIDQITRLTKELRETIKQITDYQGKTGYKSESETKIINVEGNFNVLMNMISGGALCPACQRKLLEEMDKVSDNIK